MSRRFLIRGGCVLTLDSKAGNLIRGDVLVEDGRVAEVGPAVRARDAEVVDASDSIVMPGFVDCHHHVGDSLFRNLGDSATSPASYGPLYQAEDVYAATLIGLLGAIDAGSTTVVDWCEVGADRDRIEAALQAHADAAVRSVFVHARARWAQGDEHWRSDLRTLRTKWGASPLATLAAGTPSPRPGQLDRVAANWALARELRLAIHTHAGTAPATRGVVASLGEGGLLAKDVTLTHCTHLGETDFDAISASGASVCLTPSSGMTAGLGHPPTQVLIDRRIRPGLGVGSGQTAPGDMFAQIRAVISVQHATLFDRKLAGKGGLPHLLSTREVIRYATIDGARAAGLGEVTGSLEPGKQADIIILRTDTPNIAPVNDPIGAVVWGMDTSNVDWVLVGGEVLKREGQLQGDVAKARALAVAAQGRVAAAAGALVDAGSGGGV